jgi:hypothetical protein
MACWLPDEPPCGATPTPSIGLPEEAGSGGDDAAVDECNDGGADGDSGGDFDGDGDGEAEEEEAPMLVAAAFSPLGVAPPTAAEARRAPSSFVAMLQASPANAAAAAPRAPALAPGVASAGGLPASSPYRSGAAGAGATPTHARDVPVRASAAAALHTVRRARGAPRTRANLPKPSNRHAIDVGRRVPPRARRSRRVSRRAVADVSRARAGSRL